MPIYLGLLLAKPDKQENTFDKTKFHADFIFM